MSGGASQDWIRSKMQAELLKSGARWNKWIVSYDPPTRTWKCNVCGEERFESLKQLKAHKQDRHAI